MKRALIIRHAAPESLAANYRQVLEERRFQLDALNVFESAPAYDRFSPPDPSEISLIVVLGGPLSANDDYPALQQERAYLKEAMGQGKPVLGVCLGAQMMARALGGAVGPTGGYQFGLRRISITAEGDADSVFSRIAVPLVPTLHGDCFTIPPGAVKLAEGFMLCRDGRYRRINMAFRHGNSYAFQFEPQLTLEELRVWDRELGDDYKLMGANFEPGEEAARQLREFARFAPHHEAQMREVLLAFLRNAGVVDA
jgi:GMP synthase (glutamine-hydrolysing)